MIVSNSSLSNDYALKMFSFDKFTHVGKLCQTFAYLYCSWYILTSLDVTLFTVINNSRCAIFTIPSPALEPIIFQVR